MTKRSACLSTVWILASGRNLAIFETYLTRISTLSFESKNYWSFSYSTGPYVGVGKRSFSCHFCRTDPQIGTNPQIGINTGQTDPSVKRSVFLIYLRLLTRVWKERNFEFYFAFTRIKLFCICITRILKENFCCTGFASLHYGKNSWLLLPLEKTYSPPYSFKGSNVTELRTF